MITQTPIHTKIDNLTLDALDMESYATGMKRNRIINDAIRLYIELRDAYRRDITQHDLNGHEELRRTLIKWLAHWSAQCYAEHASSALVNI